MSIDKTKVRFTLPVYVWVETKRVFIHFEPCPRILYDMVRVKQELILTRPPRQWKKDICFKVKGKEIIISFFYSEGDA